MLELFHQTSPNQQAGNIRRSIPSNTSNQSLVQLLPNPLLHIWVFEHMTQKDQLWVPGYWTGIKLYELDPLALEGELPPEQTNP